MILDHELDLKVFSLTQTVFFSQLSEAYVLLWQNSSTGDVNGRQGSKNKIGGSVCAVLLDLIAMGKIKIEFEEKKFLFVKYTDIWVKVGWIEYILLLNSGIILILLGREFHFSLLPLLRLREKNKINSLCCSLYRYRKTTYLGFDL